MASRFRNTTLLPMQVTESPWLYEYGNYYNSYSERQNQTEDDGIYYDSGKWMLYYNNSLMNEKWTLAKNIYRKNKLDGVISIKCSTAKINPRASSNDDGIIILYCSNSSNKKKIMNIGYTIIESFNYKKQKYIYYKTNEQTYEGTIATGKKKNHTYRLENKLYEVKWKKNDPNWWE